MEGNQGLKKTAQGQETCTLNGFIPESTVRGTGSAGNKG